jgi:2-methylthioadenine synthetase
MGRRYTAATYLRRLEPLAGFNLTADVIVGFPTEDEQAFEQTRRVLAAAGVTKVHVFPYSPRPGTATAAEDPVPAAVKKRRGAQLRADSHEACLERWRSKLGTTDEVLVDRPGSRVRRRLLAVARRRFGSGRPARAGRAVGVAEEGIVGAL